MSYAFFLEMRQNALRDDCVGWPHSPRSVFAMCTSVHWAIALAVSERLACSKSVGLASEVEENFQPMSFETNQ